MAKGCLCLWDEGPWAGGRVGTWEAVLCAGEHGLVGGGESPVPGRAELPPRPQAVSRRSKGSTGLCWGLPNQGSRPLRSF